MEFPFNINALLGDEITVLDRALKPFSANPTTLSQRRAELCKVIDEMGRASSRAQGLLNPITTANRMVESKHKLYLIKDEQGGSGYGAVVGLLKIGNKKLFIYDRNGVQHELEPLCVLDFYVHESCQRRGYGRKLFEEMLLREGVNVRHIAIDRPSPKFQSFLQKHYNLKATIPQVNNFVVFEGFFSDRNQTNNCNGHRQFNGRQAWSQPEPSYEGYNAQGRGGLPRDRLQDYDNHGVQSPAYSRPSSGKFNWGMSAQQAMYSRHQATPSPIDLSQVPRRDSSSPCSGPSSPPVLRRDGPSRDYLRLVSENNGTYLDRRGGHLTTTTSSQPPVGNRQHVQPSGAGYSQPPATKQGFDTAWNVFGVAPRSWPNSVTVSNASTVAAGRRYQRTNLW